MIDYTIADASGEASGYSYLTLTEIKNYLKVDASTDDSLLTDMFYAAASYIERQFKQTLKKRDIVMQYNSSEKYIDLLFCPVTTLTSITYKVDDASGTFEASSDYSSFGLADSRARSTVLTFNKGYDTVNIYSTSDGRSVPSEIKFATLAYIKVMYDNNRNFFDKDTPTIPPTETIQLMSPYKPIVI